MKFQASGWIEPSPQPIKATALVDGVIEKVFILEGESVEAGQELARIVDEDFELDLATAKNELATKQAEAAANEAAIAETAAKVATLEKQVTAGKSKLRELEDRRDRLAGVVGGGVSEEEVTLAKLRLQSFRDELDALQITRAELESESAGLVAMRSAAAAAVATAETEVARRQLALDRTTVRSPVKGIVLRLFAAPGRKSMLRMDDMDSATIATLYQPDHLQARIDVPLEEAAGLFPGQAVRLRTALLTDRVFQGTVSRIVGEADLQRNTLQVKVALSEPDPRLRPEMLCRAEFLAAGVEKSASVDVIEAGETAGAPTSSVSPSKVDVLVSTRALFEKEAKSASVWALDPSGARLESRKVVLGRDGTEGYVVALEGLRPGDRVVLDPGEQLEEGMRVKAMFTAEEHKP